MGMMGMGMMNMGGAAPRPNMGMGGGGPRPNMGTGGTGPRPNMGMAGPAAAAMMAMSGATPGSMMSAPKMNAAAKGATGDFPKPPTADALGLPDKAPQVVTPEMMIEEFRDVIHQALDFLPKEQIEEIIKLNPAAVHERGMHVFSSELFYWQGLTFSEKKE